MSQSFAQLVIGPPGSGKSTYCKAMKHLLTILGREVTVVNLDPANEALPYECGVDVSELITLQDVMEKLKLGPNGSLIYCMEYLEKNLDWLKSRLDQFRGRYFLFDCPGQVELYTHHCAVRNIAQQLDKWKFKVFAAPFKNTLSLTFLPFSFSHSPTLTPYALTLFPNPAASSCSFGGLSLLQ